MPKPIPYKFRLAYFFAFVLAFIIGFPILLFYSAGYTLDDTLDGTLGLSFRGGVYVFISEPDTSVFIGNELKSQSSFFQKEILVDQLKPGQYLVLAANDNFWPWAKLVNVKRGEVEALFPLLVPKEIAVTEIVSTDSGSDSGSDSDYDAVAELFEVPIISKSPVKPSVSVGLSSTSTTLESITRRRVKIFLKNNTIFAQWTGSAAAAPKYFCNLTAAAGTSSFGADLVADPSDETKNCLEPVVVFKSFVPIRSFDFYPSRDDAIILALDNGIYAIEIDRREYQNFYPLYRGQSPDFRIDGDLVYIKDNDYLASLDLE